MTGGATIEKEAFNRRYKKLIYLWVKQADLGEGNKILESMVKGIEAILILSGDSKSLSGEEAFEKNISLQNWLFGYEFPKTIFLLLPTKLQVLTSSGKGDILKSVNDDDSSMIETSLLGKTEGDMDKSIKDYISQFVKPYADKNKLAIVSYNDLTMKNKFGELWKKNFDSLIDTLPLNLDEFFSVLLSTKDDNEAKLIRRSATLNTKFFKAYVLEEMVKFVAGNKRITNLSLANRFEETLQWERVWNKIGGLKNRDELDYIDWAVPPLVLSNSTFDLNDAYSSNEEELKDGVIILKTALRYMNYCSCIMRTFIIEGKKEQENKYLLLAQVHNFVIESLKPGVKCSEIYNNTLKFLTQRDASKLQDNLITSLGSVTGIEYSDNFLQVSKDNEHVVSGDMVWVIKTGFQNLINTEDNNNTYSLAIADTVFIKDNEPIVLTDFGTKLDDITYYFNDEDDKPKEVENGRFKNKESNGAKSIKPPPTRAEKSAVLKSKFRSEEHQGDETPEQKIRMHQRALLVQRKRDGMDRFQTDDNDLDDGTNIRKKKLPESYKRDTAFPKELNSLKLTLDPRNDSIICPINGYAVPFHITMLKNISKNEEGSHIYLRLNFVSPGQGVIKKDELPVDDPTANYLRSLTYRSSDLHRMNELYRKITELKKETTKRENEKKEREDIVEQDQLLEIKGKRATRLSEVMVRPILESGKKLGGDLEIHSNGLRYISPRSNKIFDILFSNVKHLFFQPCDKELIVLIHFHLKNPILMGKKKTKDVQFYRETSDMVYDETGNRRRGINNRYSHNYGDEDELMQEQEERKRMIQLNAEFKSFGDKIVDASKNMLNLDVPYRELSFYGVPQRVNVLLQPTTDCLVHLTDFPFTVITLNEIELVHLERVQLGIKNFDMVIVFKNFQNPPVHINTIPMSQLQAIKEWLDSIDIPFTEGPVNLNWNTIMKTIRDDPLDFYRGVGWEFLADFTTNSDGEQIENEDSEEDSGSEFEPDESMLAEESSESSFEDNDEDFEESSEEEPEAEDWDELEEKTIQQEREDIKRKSAVRPSGRR